MNRSRTNGASPAVRSALIQIGRHLGPTVLTNLRSVLSYLEIGAWARSVADNPIRQLPTRFDLFAEAASRVRGSQPLYLEFGVYEGRSMRWWLEHLTAPEAKFVGFDSFEGLPADWRPGIGKGRFATGKVPEIDDARVSFVRGWFNDTLPVFELPEHDQLIINIDSDLYLSAATALECLEPHIVPGTLIHFDELPDRDHEMRAFFESLHRSNLRVEPIAYARGGLHWLFQYVSTGAGMSHQHGGSSVDRTQAHPAVQMVELRTEEPPGAEGKHFCPLCQCTKSGWADVSHMTADWCEDLRCPCHADEQHQEHGV